MNAGHGKQLYWRTVMARSSTKARGQERIALLINFPLVPFHPVCLFATRATTPHAATRLTSCSEQRLTTPWTAPNGIVITPQIRPIASKATR